MKTIKLFTIIMLALLGLSLSLTVAAQQDEDELQPGLAMVMPGAGRHMRVHPEPDSRTDPLIQLEPGDVVTIIEHDGRWARITVEGEDIEGWMRTSTLRNINALSPLPRGYHAMAYDSLSGQVFMYGGGLSPEEFFDDTWVFDSNDRTWAKVNEAAQMHGQGNPLVYHPGTNQLIYVLGFGSVIGGSLGQTLSYNTTSNTWVNLEPDITPPELLGPGMVLDSESDRMILFGGIDVERIGSELVYLDGTWSYDPNENTWQQMSPEINPPARNYPAMAYHAEADRAVLFGGDADGIISDDTWAYDFNTDSWERIETDIVPPARDYSAMVYAPVSESIILFGGHTEDEIFNDTWALSFEAGNWSWTELNPDDAPSPRAWHAMAYDTRREQVVIFGGGTYRGNYTMETWLYDPVENTWTQVGP